jgi:hypothetical protein
VNKPPSCYWCEEPYGLVDEDEWVPECDCAAREARREEAYWREVDRRIDEARGK